MLQKKSFQRLVSLFVTDDSGNVRTGAQTYAYMRFLFDSSNAQTTHWLGTPFKADLKLMSRFLSHAYALDIATEVSDFYSFDSQFMKTELLQRARMVEGWIHFGSGKWQSLVARYGANQESVNNCLDFYSKSADPNSLLVYDSLANVNSTMPPHHYKCILSPMTIALCNVEGDLVAIVDQHNNAGGVSVRYAYATRSMIHQWRMAKLNEYLVDLAFENSYPLFANSQDVLADAI